MKSSKIGTSCFGLRLPIIKKGDDLKEIILDSLIEAKESGEYNPKNGDIIGITESIVARSQGKYCTIDDIVKDLKKRYPNNECLYVYNPIFSRNRFSIILRGLASYFKRIVIISEGKRDEVGNRLTNHSQTGLDYDELYKKIAKEQGCVLRWEFRENLKEVLRWHYNTDVNVLDCTLHLRNYSRNHEINSEIFNAFCEVNGQERDLTWGDDGDGEEISEKLDPDEYTEVEKESEKKELVGFIPYTLKDICWSKDNRYGLLGSNKVNETTLKLFPGSKEDVRMVNDLKFAIELALGISDVEVMIYGDGCFKDADTEIWEFADPVVSPAYTNGLEGQPSELKLKYLADEEKYNSGMETEEIVEDIKSRIRNKNNLALDNPESQGCTPRNYVNLLGSLMDLVTGSGDKGTPIVIVQGYFKNYADE